LFAAFPYSSRDIAFSEELASRVSDFRKTAAEYFGSFTADELSRTNEEIIKRDLLDRYNGMLRLGKIETLFFNDYMIIE
jgi:flagellar basal body-associated protein FliL